MSGAIIGHAAVQVGLDTSPIQNGMMQLKQKMTAGVAALKGIFAVQLAGEGRRMVQAFAPMIEAAANTKEATRRFTESYRENSSNLLEWVNHFAERMAAGGSESINMFHRTAIALEQMGIAAENVPAMTKNLMKLAADLKAINPEIKTIDDAVLRLITGLIGGTRGLMTLGISMRQSALDAVAARLGISKQTLATDDAARATVALHAILERGGNILGASDRAMSDYSSRLDHLRYQFGELKEAIGNAFLEGLKPFIDGMISWLQAGRAFIAVNNEIMASFEKTGLALSGLGIIIAALATSFGGIVALITLIGSSIIYVGEAFGLWDLGFTKALENIFVGGASLQTWFITVSDTILAILKLWGKEFAVVFMAPFNLIESVFASIIQTIAAGLYSLFSALHMNVIATKMSGIMDIMDATWKAANARIDTQKPYAEYQAETKRIQEEFTGSSAVDMKRKAARDKAYADEKARLEALRAASVDVPALPGWSGEGAGGEKKKPGIVSLAGNAISEMLGALWGSDAKTEGQEQIGLLEKISEAVEPLNKTLTDLPMRMPAFTDPALKGIGEMSSMTWANEDIKKFYDSGAGLRAGQKAAVESNGNLVDLLNILNKQYEEQKKISANTENMAPAYQ